MLIEGYIEQRKFYDNCHSNSNCDTISLIKIVPRGVAAICGCNATNYNRNTYGNCGSAANVANCGNAASRGKVCLSFFQFG